MQTSPWSSIGLLIFCSLFTTHCGYYWGHGNRSLPQGYKTIFIEVFENRSNEAGAEMLFTRALTEEFRRSGFIQVTTRERADVVLKGVLLSINYHGQTLTKEFKDQEGNTIPSARLFADYNINVMASLQLVKTLDKKRIWQDTLRGLKSYRPSQIKSFGVRSSNPLYNQSSKELTLNLVAKDMMNDAFSRMTENF